MIAKAIPGFYDFDGKRISQPSRKRHPPFKGRPMGSFLSQPLKTTCRDLDEVRAFLSTCRYVPDEEQFGVKDHWAPPVEFERVRQGDCDCFALWTCRQLLALGYEARFIVGRAGRYGDGHAWVAFRAEGEIFIVEPVLSLFQTFPRLETLRYRPAISVEIAGSQVRFFEHAQREVEPPLRVVAALVPEWLVFWLRICLRVLLRLPLWPYRALTRQRRRRRATARTQATEPQ